MGVLTAIAPSKPSTRTPTPARKRVLLVVNPASRRGGRLRDKAMRAFAEAGAVCDVLETTPDGAAGRLAAERASGYDAIFTLGGDGTAMEVIGALTPDSPPIGVLPGGTGNLLARSLGIPLRIKSAVRLLLSGDEAKIDLGMLSTGRRFAFAAGIGIDVDMVESAPARLKRHLGVLAYVLSASRALVRRQEFLVRAEVDGTVYERRASSVLLANFGAVLNDLLTLGPGIRHDDGQLDLCVFSPRGFFDSLRIGWRLLRRQFGEDAAMLYVAGRRFRIETDPPRGAQADGELIGSTPFEAYVEPLAARLLVPRRG